MRSRVLVVALALALGASGTASAQSAPETGTAGLSGTVTSEGGQVLAGVCVDVFSERGFGSATTGADGRYLVEDLPAGEYGVAFNLCEQPLPGFAAELYDDVTGPEQSPTPVVVTEGATTSGIDAVLMTGATIAGRVTADADARPLEGVCVGAYSEQGGSMGQDRTAADGSYAISTLRGGDHQVVFTDCSAPFTFLGEAYDDVPAAGGSVGPGGPERTPTPVTVADRGQVAGIDAALAEGGSLQGTVTALHTGRPVDGVCVGLLPVDGDDGFGPQSTGFTGFQPDGRATPGEYVVPSVQPGTYVVGFNPADFCGDDGYSAVWFDGAAAPQDAEPVVVEAADVLTGFDAVVAPRPSISAACEVFGPPAPPSFSDVPDGNLHASAIDCIARRELTSGRGDGTFGPVEDVRRDQLASFVTRALAAVGVDLPARPADAFADDEGSVHELAIDQLAALGVVVGGADGRFDPRGTVTRAQMATFVVRAYETATDHELRVVRDVFTDDQGQVHERSTDKAAVAGLAVGRTTTTYQPQDTVNREQMATFLARLLDRVQRDLPFGTVGPGLPAPAGSGVAQLAALSPGPAAEAALLIARSR